MRFKRGLREAGLFASKVPALSVWEEGDERNLGACMPGLEPNEGEEVITKTHPSAFFGTTLTSRLRFMGIDTLVICGATTSGAVRATASDAMRENYRPMVRCYVFRWTGSQRTDIVIRRLLEQHVQIPLVRFMKPT